MADLPKVWTLGDHPPFCNTRVNFFSSFYVSHGHRTDTRYGVIFSCLGSRAVHLELASSLDTSSFTSALWRFISHRGPVNCIMSDNRTNFVGADCELMQLVQRWNQAQINRYLLQTWIQWKFSTPSVSQNNGVWEWEIRTIQNVLTALTEH